MASGKQYLGAIFPVGTVHADGTTTSRQYTSEIHTGVMLVLKRTAETGVCTLDAKIQYKNELTGDWNDLPLASFVQFADAATGTRMLLLSPMPVADTEAAGDLRGTLTLTNDKYVQGYLPRIWRVAVVTGGTTVTNTFSLTATALAS